MYGVGIQWVGAGRRILAALLLPAILGAWVQAPISSARAQVGRAAPRSAGRSVTYQATDAYLTGGAVAGNSGGLAYVTHMAKAGAVVIFTVSAPTDGVYGVMLRYADGESTPATLEIRANGILLNDVSLTPTGGWDAWADQTEHLRLRAGLNTLALSDDAGSGADAHLTSLSVSSGNARAARGATLPYVEYEAENASTNGVIIGPDRDYTSLASEASGRKAVTLRGQGRYVEFTLTQPANGMMLRYSIPDSPSGLGLTARLSLSINGRYLQAVTLTSKYDWFYGGYPFSNKPADQTGQHFYDEVHTLFPSMLSAGTKVRVQVEAGDTAPSYTIDLADFERVPQPYGQPAGYLSAASYGVDPTGLKNSTAALQRAVNAAEARKKGLYVPAGIYTITGHTILDRVTIRGAGPWYTVLHGSGVGLYGKYAPTPSGQVGIYDLAIQGETTDRIDAAQVNGIGGSLGSGSVIQNVWIEHTKVGMWFDGPFSGLLVVGCRIRDVTADGINLHDGISNVTVEQTQLRNLGDDGLAMWSDNDADSQDVFRFNTVQLPILANNFAMYGGTDNSITDNYGADTITQGGGINVGNRDFGSAVVPLSGTITLARNTLVRTGQFDPNWDFGVGAIWFYAQTMDIKARINVVDDEIDDSTNEAVQFVGDFAVRTVTFDHLTIAKAATYAFQVQTPASAIFTHVTATGLGRGGIYDCGEPFTVKLGIGNAGWNKKVCGSLT